MIEGEEAVPSAQNQETSETSVRATVLLDAGSSAPEPGNEEEVMGKELLLKQQQEEKDQDHEMDEFGWEEFGWEQPVASGWEEDEEQKQQQERREDYEDWKFEDRQQEPEEPEVPAQGPQGGDEPDRARRKKTTGTTRGKKILPVKEKADFVVPIAIDVYYVQPDPAEWAALPCGEVKLVRERLEFTVGRKKSDQKNDNKNETIEWDKIAKHLRD